MVRVECHGALGQEVPVPARGAGRAEAVLPARYDWRHGRASAVAAKIQVPRWIQLVGLPLVLLFLWVVAGAARHVVFLFLIAALIAFLLNPLVRGLTRVWIPRGFGVAIVYVGFVAIIVAAAAAIGTVVVNQTKSSASRVDDYFTVAHGRPYQTHAYRDVDRFQQWLDSHRLELDQGPPAGPRPRQPDSQEGRLEVHRQGHRLRRGGGDRHAQVPLQPRPRDRGLDLHAARHAAAGTRRGPALPAPSGVAVAAPADRALARQLRARPVPALADHRHERGARALAARDARAGSRARTSTPCCSARGSRSPS